MPSIPLEQFIWTTQDITCVPDGVLGCHCYREKGKVTSKYGHCRQAHEEKRGSLFTLSSKQHGRLMDSLRELEALLQQQATVEVAWREEAEIQVVLESGLLLSIGLSDSRRDPERLLVDRSLVGRLHNERLTSGGVGEECLVLGADNSTVVDIVTFSRPVRRPSVGSEGGKATVAPRRPEKLSAMSMKLGSLSLGLPDGLKVRKRVRFSARGDTFAVWWSSHLWPPADDLHNVTICRVEGMAARKVVEFTTEYPLVAMDFRRCVESEFALAESQQKSKDNFVLHVSLYELRENEMVLRRRTCVSLTEPVLAWDVHPNEELFLLRTDNGKCVLYDMNFQQAKEVAHSNVAVVRWQPRGAVFLTVSVSGELRCYDRAGGAVDFLFQDTFAAKPRPAVSLVKYFRCNKRVLRMTISRTDPSCFLLLHESGPLSLVVTADACVCSSSTDLVTHYCAEGRLQEAVRLLRAMHWNSHPDQCFLSLTCILSAITSKPLLKENIGLCEEALGSFFISRTPLSDTVRLEFQERLMQLTRRFFFFLLRHRQMEKAFLLAEDLGHRDLFSDIHSAAMRMGDPVLAEVARLRTLRPRRGQGEGSGDETEPSSDSEASLVIDDEDLPEELLAPDREEQFAFEEALLHSFTAVLSAADPISDATPRADRP